MRKKTYRKLRKLSVEYYDLECTRALGGLGGGHKITPSELQRHKKLKKFLYGHPNKAEYDRIINAECNAMCLFGFQQSWDGTSHTYRRKFWKHSYDTAVAHQKAIWARQKAYRERRIREQETQAAEDKLQPI